MRFIFQTLAIVLLLAVGTAYGSERDGARVTHSEPLRELLIRRRGAETDASEAIRGPVSMGFDALGRHFDLDLETNTSLLAPAALAALDNRTSVLRGSIAGEPGSWARVVLVDGQPSGILFDGQELLAIEPAEEGGRESRIFRLADLMMNPGAMSCAVGDGPQTGLQMYQDLVAELRPPVARAAGAIEEIEIGVLADSLFAEGRANPAQSLLTRINNVDGIYSSELGVQITVPTAPTVFDAGNDPFIDVPEVDGRTEADELLDELADFRTGSAAQREFGLTHLFTGRVLTGSTVGIAFIGVLCNARFGVGLTEGSLGDGPGEVTVDSLIAAHEIGHNFGASHDGEVGGSCPLAPANDFIMATRVNFNPEFSDCSKDVMLQNAAAAACIRALPARDMRISSFQQPETALLGTTLNLTFAADNRGSSPVSDVVVDFELPANVSLLSVTPSQGSCDSGAGTLRCTLGVVPGSSGATIVLSTNTLATGDATFVATVAAPADEFADNNVDTHVVTIEPAVNLVVTGPPAVTIDIDATTAANLTIRNTASLDATDVDVVVSVGPGLSAQTASWTAGNCTVSPQSVVCTARTLAAGTDSTLSLDVQGTSAGNRAYSVEVTANETDADVTDNSAQASVTVVDPNRPGGGVNSTDDDGGGSFGLFLLALLGGATLRRRTIR